MKITISFLIVSLLTFMSFIDEKHPYHVGSVELNHNAKTQTFEITAKYFLDDLENAVSKRYGKSIHFSDAKPEAQMNHYLEAYTNENLKLKVNNKMLTINYLGYEEDRESVIIYAETTPVKNPKKVEVANSFIYNLFDDQINIIHIIVQGNRKSDKLVYPNRYVFKNF